MLSNYGVLWPPNSHGLMDDGALLSLSLHGLHVCRVYKLGPLLSQWSPTKAESLFKRYTLWIGTIFSTLSIRLTPFESMAMAPTAGGERRAMPKVPNSSHLKHHPRLQLLVRCRVGQRRGMVGKGGGQDAWTMENEHIQVSTRCLVFHSSAFVTSVFSRHVLAWRGT